MAKVVGVDVTKIKPGKPEQVKPGNGRKMAKTVGVDLSKADKPAKGKAAKDEE